jgi:hypothetical protein
MTKKAEIIARAIATAEGFYAPGPHDGHSLPYALNNPGDLEASSIPYDGKVQGKCRFKTLADGWAALAKELDLISSGHSHVYSPAQSLKTFAYRYVGDASAAGWLTNLLSYCKANGLDLTENSTLAEALVCSNG